MIDECVVDSWALAKFKPQRSQRAGNLGRLDSELSIESNTNILEVLSTYRESIVRNRRNYYVEKINEGKLIKF
jgi:hypothetical protein